MRFQRTAASRQATCVAQKDCRRLKCAFSARRQAGKPLAWLTKFGGLKMENGKKREWIKNAVIVFLIVMLILTLFSNTIMNYSLPEVAAQYCYSGQITNKVRGNGVVETDDPYKVEFKESRVIESVAVREGDYVEKDAVLYYLEAGESEELKEAIKNLEDKKAAYEQKIISEAISREVTSAVNSGSIGSLESNQAKIEAAKTKVKNAQTRVDALTKQQEQYSNSSTSNISENKALKDAQDALKSWEDQNAKDQANLTSIEAEYNLAKSNDADAQEKIDDATRAKNMALQHYNDVSDNDPDTDGDGVGDAEGDLKKAEEALADANYEKTKTEKKVADLKPSYDGAAANAANSAQQVANYTQAVKDAQQALDNKTYDISTQLADAKTALERANKEYEELIDKLSKEYALDDMKKEIADLQVEVEKLRSTSGGDTITAPVAGTILSMKYVAGETIEKGSEVAEIQKAGKGFRLTMNVTNDQAKYITIGDEAEVTNSWWYTDVHAKVSQIRPDKTNPSNGKIVVFELEGEDLTNGQNLTLTVGSRTANYENIVPSSAIQKDDKGKFIYRIEAKSTPLGNRYIAHRVDVEILAESENETAVSGDLSGWEYIITNASKPVEDGKQVRLKE